MKTTTLVLLLLTFAINLVYADCYNESVKVHNFVSHSNKQKNFKYTKNGKVIHLNRLNYTIPKYKNAILVLLDNYETAFGYADPRFKHAMLLEKIEEISGHKVIEILYAGEINKHIANETAGINDEKLSSNIYDKDNKKITENIYKDKIGLSDIYNLEEFNKQTGTLPDLIEYKRYNKKIPGFKQHLNPLLAQLSNIRHFLQNKISNIQVISYGKDFPEKEKEYMDIANVEVNELYSAITLIETDFKIGDKEISQEIQSLEPKEKEYFKIKDSMPDFYKTFKSILTKYNNNGFINYDPAEFENFKYLADLYAFVFEKAYEKQSKSYYWKIIAPASAEVAPSALPFWFQRN